MNKIAPSQSYFPLSVGSSFGMNGRAKIKEIRAIGQRIIYTACHPTTSVSAPASSGPASCPMKTPVMATPIAVPRSSTLTADATNATAVPNISAFPIPSMARIIKTISPVVEKPIPREPNPSRRTPIQKNSFLLNLSAKRAAGIRKIVEVRR